MQSYSKAPEKWLTTVSKLVKVFNKSLNSLVPSFKKLKIGWLDEEQFDAFDGISEALYQWMVIDKLESYILEKYNDELHLAKYNFHYKNYSKLSFINVFTDKEDPIGYNVFLNFMSVDQPFDTVVCHRIDVEGNIVQRQLQFKLENVKFRFKYRKNASELVDVKEFELTLED